MSISGNDVVLNDGSVLKNGSWSKWTSPKIPRDIMRTYPAKIHSQCKIPQEQIDSLKLSTYESESWKFCMENGVWFGKRPYCSEGLNQTGSLYFLPKGGQRATDFSSKISPCETVGQIAQVGQETWLALIQPGEWGPYSGDGIYIYNHKTRQWRKKSTRSLTGSVILSMVYQKDKGRLWLLSTWGIDQYDVRSKQWEKRYFSPQIDQDFAIETRLSKTEPNLTSLWQLYHIRWYTIRDRAGFIKAWPQEYKFKYYSGSQVPVLKDDLLPFYLDTLKTTEREDLFTRLLDDIGRYEGDKTSFKEVLVELKKRSNMLTTMQRNTLLTWMNYYNIQDTSDIKFQQFEALMSADLNNYQDLQNLCNFIKKEEDYRQQLMEWIRQASFPKQLKHKVLARCIVDHIRSYSNTPLRDMVGEQIKSDDPRQIELACVNLRNFPVYPESKSNLGALILSRTTLAKGLTSYKNGKECTTIPVMAINVCKQVLLELLSSSTNIGLVIKELLPESEYQQEAMNALQQVTQQRFTTVQQWQQWWQSVSKTYTPPVIYKFEKYMLQGTSSITRCDPLPRGPVSPGGIRGL